MNMQMYPYIQNRGMQVCHSALQRTSIFRDEVERHNLASGRQNLLVQDMLTGCHIKTDDSPGQTVPVQSYGADTRTCSSILRQPVNSTYRH